MKKFGNSLQAKACPPPTTSAPRAMNKKSNAEVQCLVRFFCNAIRFFNSKLRLGEMQENSIEYGSQSTKSWEAFLIFFNSFFLPLEQLKLFDFPTRDVRSARWKIEKFQLLSWQERKLAAPAVVKKD